MEWSVDKVRFTTWLDILPPEIQQKIWKMVYRNTLAKLSEFRMYQGVLRQYMRRAFRSDVKDILFNRSDDLIIIVRKDRVSSISVDHIEDETFNPKTVLTGLFIAPPSASESDRRRIEQTWRDGPRTVLKQFNSCNILDPRVVNSLSKAYGLCKTVMDDWKAIGRWDERAASRFTYPDGLRQVFSKKMWASCR